jgi:DNA-binding LacI/PurR family transcriptional regulator
VASREGFVINRVTPVSAGRRPARLVDIAAAVGLHVSTVSRVLNDDANLSIRPDTRSRILLAAARLGYRPNAMARGLKASRTGALAMVVPLLRNPIWSSVQRGALHAAAAASQVVMILEEPEDDLRPPSDYQYLIQESRADGLLIATARRSGGESPRSLTVPHVYLNRRGPQPGNNVVMDEEAAMRLFVEHLHDLGHKRIGIVDGVRAVDTVQRRAVATRALCAERGMTPTFEHAEDAEAAGYEATVRLLSRRSIPTALGVGNLSQLFGMLKALREAGANVPSDISVVSFDEDQCLAFLEVPIVSVSMPLFGLGVAAVQALILRVDGLPGVDVLVSDPPVLIARASTAPPRHTGRLRI